MIPPLASRGMSLFAAVLITACAPVTQNPPAAFWDNHPQGADWTQTAIKSLSTDALPLVEIVPEDVAQWCPAYETAPVEMRAAFWTGLASRLAETESSLRPEVSSPNGKWHGLLQISPATARGYGCDAGTREALKDGSANIACALRIWSVTVPRDGVIAADLGGVAADWGPMQRPRPREDIRAWISAQDYCQTDIAMAQNQG